MIKNKLFNSVVFFFIILNLLGIYGYIFTVILNYDLAWMVFEKLKTHIWILKNGTAWHWSDLATGFDTLKIEIDPNRITRPLSNIVEVIDAKFRANLWEHIPPHPSLSLQWPLLFVGLPIFFWDSKFCYGQPFLSDC